MRRPVEATPARRVRLTQVHLPGVEPTESAPIDVGREYCYLVTDPELLEGVGVGR